ncbi:MAG: VanW family protein [Armatimonadetes bacterium]|nr:VanW family protein [Armatimonadota bacterium]
MPRLHDRMWPVVRSLLAAAAVLGGAWVATRPAPNAGGMRVIASTCTSLAGRTNAQRANALLAASLLNDRRLPPGGELSFNRCVGEWTPRRGFVRAPVSSGGIMVQAHGGGVCQTSTTLYGAALRGGLTILERHRHEVRPRYAPPGLDAAVAFGAADLRIRNDYTFPVQLRAGTVGDLLTVSLLGTGPTARCRLEVTGEPGGAARPLLVGGLGRSSGRRIVRQAGSPGWAVTTTRRWIVAGRPDRREVMSVDRYRAASAVINTGTPPSDPASTVVPL